MISHVDRCAPKTVLCARNFLYKNDNFCRPGPGKKKSLFNLIGHQPDIDEIYLYAKHLYDAKHQLPN